MHIVMSVIPRFCNSQIFYSWVNVLMTIVLLSITVQYDFVSEHQAQLMTTQMYAMINTGLTTNILYLL